MALPKQQIEVIHFNEPQPLHMAPVLAIMMSLYEAGTLQINENEPVLKRELLHLLVDLHCDKFALKSIVGENDKFIYVCIQPLDKSEMHKLINLLPTSF